MSQLEIDTRVQAVEREQVRQSERLTRIEADGIKTLSAVEKLVERDAGRPQGLTWREFLAGVVTTLTIGGGLWWAVSGFVEHAPAVVELKQRMDQAEWRYGWATRVDKP